MNNKYKILNNIQTRLITWGNPFDCNGEDVIVCVTGNPGMPDFYIEFGSELYKLTNLPVCIIGHAGHEEVPDRKSNILKGQEHLFNLEGQIQHKLDLIRNIDKQSKLHLIGHSIGSWLILKMLRKNDNLIQKVSTVNLLFPTIQKMAQSKNGRFLNNFVRKIHILVMLLFTLAYLLPDFIRTFLISCFLKYNSLPLQYKDRILKYCNPKVGEKVMFLAYDEMDNVTTLDTEIIDKIKQLCNVIYSNHEDWAPADGYQDLMQFQPGMHLNKVDIDHAFVLKSSEVVAEMVADFIKAKN